MSNADQITSKLENLTHFIEDAKTKLQGGEVVHLSHLDGEVEQLCQQTLKLPPAEAMRVQPIMGNMISKLEELGLALKDFQISLKGQ